MKRHMKRQVLDFDIGKEAGRDFRERKREKSNFQWGSNRYKATLDIFRLRDESIGESDKLPDPDVLAQEIGEIRDSPCNQTLS